MRSVFITCVALATITIAGCDLVDPARPSVQQDTEVFGNFLDVSKSDDADPYWTVTLQAGAPRALRAAEEEQGKPTPAVEKGLLAKVKVTAETVVMLGDRPGGLDDIDPGTEVVVLPVPGSTQMLGSDEVRVEAATLMDFRTYTMWRLPKLGESDPTDADATERINTAGSEFAPVPVAGGGVLYFTAHLRPPAREGESWYGALRDGLTLPDENHPPVERSYRTELGEDGWATPELVEFPGLEVADLIRVTWVNDEETRCLMTVIEGGGLPWMAVAERSDGASSWGTPERIDALEDDASDGVFLTGSSTKILFVSTRGNRDRSDLFLHDPTTGARPMPLEPQISTFGSEWCPRTGPQGELFFCRDDRQLILKGGGVRALRLPGPHRVLFTQAKPTSDGRWLFFCMPRYRPLEFDDDIFVAPLDEEMGIGEPVPVDDWRP